MGMDDKEARQRIRRHHRRLLPMASSSNNSDSAGGTKIREAVSCSMPQDVFQRANCEQVTLLEGRRKYVCAALASQTYDHPLLRTSSYSEFGTLRAGRRRGESASRNLLHVFLNSSRTGWVEDRKLEASGFAIVLGGLVMVVKIGVLLLSRSFCSGAWPYLQALSICTLSSGPLKLPEIPQAIQRVVQHIAGPVLGLTIAQPLVYWCLPDVYRTARFWRRLLPIYLGYMRTKRQVRQKPAQEKEKIWAGRHEWGGEKVHKLVLDMSGFYVKSAQILASKADFIPEPWTRRLSSLLDNAPPRPYAEVERSIMQQLSTCPCHSALPLTAQGLVPLDAVFLHVDPTAIAAASIAQVHAGVLRDETRVVIKVQHLGMEKVMQSDLRNIGWGDSANPNVQGTGGRFSHPSSIVFEQAGSYVLRISEAKFQVAKFLEGQLPCDLVPIVKEIQATIPLEFDFEREVWFMMAIKRSLGANGFDHIVCPAPMPELCAKRLIVMERLDGVPFTHILHPNAPQELQSRIPEVVSALEHLVHAYGQMLLVDGVFHADPHAGNLLLLPDGRLGLLDYGQSKVLEKGMRKKLALMVQSLSSNDDTAIARALLQLGLVFKDIHGGVVSDSRLATMARIMFDTCYMQEATVSPMSEDSVLRTTPLTAFNQAIWMVVRALVILRGLCFALKMDLSATSIWLPYARMTLAELDDS